MERAGLGDAPRTLIEELAKIKSGDVVLPAQFEAGSPLRTIRLRSSVPAHATATQRGFRAARYVRTNTQTLSSRADHRN